MTKESSQETVPQTSVSNADADNIAFPNLEKNRQEDLANLAKINGLIDALLTTPEQQAEILKAIGDTAKAIHFKDKSPSYLRNKYGSVDRSDKAKRRNGGLELVHLGSLATTATMFNDAQVTLPKEDFEKIKAKISLIIEAETNPPTKTEEETHQGLASIGRLNDFERFSGLPYVAKITHKISEILQDPLLKDLDFSQRTDRYYLGTALLKTGELSKDLIDFVNNGKDGGLFKLFKKIRNVKMAHSPSLMVHGGETEEKTLQLITEHLFPALGQEIIALQNNLQEGKEMVLEGDFASLSHLQNILFTDKVMEITPDTLHETKTAPKAKSNKEQKAKKEITSEKIPGLLSGIDNKIDIILNPESKDRFVKKAKKELTKMVEAHNKVNAENPLTIDTNQPLDASLLNPLKENVAARLLLIATNQDTQKEELEEEVTSEKKKELSPAETIEKLSHQISTLTQEVSYLNCISNDSAIPAAKQSNIQQFCLTKIAHIFDAVKESKNATVTQSTANALVFKQNISASIAARNQGIAHDPLHFNEETFSQTIQTQTLALEQDLEALKEIVSFDPAQFKDQNLNFKYGETLNNIGFYQNRLGNYEEAQKALEEALEIFNGSAALKDLNASPGKIMVQCDQASVTYQSYVLNNLFAVHMNRKDYSAALNAINQFVDLTGDASCYTISNQGSCLLHLGELTQAQTKFALALEQAQSPEEKGTVLSNQLSEHARSKSTAPHHILRQLETISEEMNNNPELKLSTLIHLGSSYCQDHHDVAKAFSYCTKAQTYFKENERGFRSLPNNKALNLEQKLIELEMAAWAGKLVSHGNASSPLLPFEDVTALDTVFKKAEDFSQSPHTPPLQISKAVAKNLSIFLSNAALFVMQDKPKTCLNLLQKSLFLNTTYALNPSITLLNIGLTHHALSQNKRNVTDNRNQALAYFEQAKSSDPDQKTLIKIHEVIGIVQEEKGNLKEAAASYMKSYSLMKTDDPTYGEVKQAATDCFNKLRIANSRSQASFQR